MRDSSHAHVLTPGGPEPNQLSVPANRGEAPRGYPLLRLGPLASTAFVSAAHSTGPLGGGAFGSSARSGSLPSRLLLLSSAASGRHHLLLHCQSQQVVPPKSDSTVAPCPRLPISAVREAALAAVPLLEHLPPLGNRQTLKSLALIQGVGCRLLALADRARPLLPRSRGCLKFRRKIAAENCCGKLLRKFAAEICCGKFLRKIAAENCCGKFRRIYRISAPGKIQPYNRAMADVEISAPMKISAPSQNLRGKVWRPLTIRARQNLPLLTSSWSG
jgi:hypothetical protein